MNNIMRKSYNTIQSLDLQLLLDLVGCFSKWLCADVLRWQIWQHPHVWPKNSNTLRNKSSNPFFLLLKLPQMKKNRIGVTLPFFLVGHNWILNCGNWESIGGQDGETMGSTPYQWNRLLPGCFFMRVPSHKFFLLFLSLRCSLEY